MKRISSILKFVIIIIVIALLLIFFISIRQLYESSSIRAFIVQMSNFDSAIDQFYTKYEALPGDLKSTVEFGLSKDSSDGNNNGIIEDRNNHINSASGEVTNFWMHLSRSGMINQNFDGLENQNAKIDSSFPRSVIGNSVGITVFGYNGKNYYQVGVDGANDKNIIMSDNSFRSEEAADIDIKIDDGFPFTGRIIATSGELLNQFSQNKKCVFDSEYNIKSKIPSCQLRIEIGAFY